MVLQDDVTRVAHLLRRAGLGASKAEVDYYSKMGWREAVNALIDYEKVDESYDGLEASLVNKNGQMNPRVVQVGWVYRLLTTKRPLQERMTLFWHNHFATSASKVQAGRLMLAQMDLFRKHALGNFRDLLIEVSKDPAMILWLDNNTNVKGKPNENYARELMELFTMGIGNYTEKDIQEAARAFTGWTVGRGGNKNNRAAFRFNRLQHDNGEKVVLGQRGNFDGTDVIDILVKHPATANYLCKKLWEYFAYPNPEPAVMNALVKTYFDSNYSIKEVVKRILTANSFYSEKAYRSLYKSPVDFTIGSLRALGAGIKLPNLIPSKAEMEDAEKPMTVETLTPLKRRAFGLVGSINQVMKNMGQELLFPPTVKGWDGGKEWVNSATMIIRIKFADALFTNIAPAGRGNNQNRTPVVRGRGLFTADDVLGEREFERSAEIVNRLLGLLDAELPTEKRKQLIKAVEYAGGVDMIKNNAEATKMIGHLTKLVFASPEFQFC